VIRLRRWWLVVGGVLVLSAGWWGPRALRPFSFFAVRRVEVVGTRYLEPATVVAALRLGPRASVWADTKRMERRLGELAGVRSATVARRLPSTLVVKVVEVEPVALAVGPTGLVPVDDGGRPLPYDPAVTPVDAPVIERAAPPLVATLAAIRATDYGLFADITAARAAAGGGGDVVLDLDDGRVRLTAPLDPAVVRAVSAVRRDLAARGQAWQELDGRFRGWVVVRRPEASREAPKPSPRTKLKTSRPSRRPARPARPAGQAAPGVGAA
jgi:POTRA domain-containing FtsQ-type protein